MIHSDQQEGAFESQMTESEETIRQGASVVHRSFPFTVRCHGAAVLALGAAA